MKVLTLDVGGSHVKALVSGARKPRGFESGPALTPSRMVEAVLALTADWKYAVVSLGYPGVVVHQRIAQEPRHLGEGWVGFDFARAFGRPVRLLNDAAMQALGSYRSGKMLFLGLGTGLGSAMIVDGRLEAMELGHLPCGHKGHSYEHFVGERARRRHGTRKWRREVWKVVAALRAALEPDTVVVGGGNARRLKQVPPGVRVVDNSKAFIGGLRMWEDS